MNVLVVNDDGIFSKGIKALVDALSAKSTVYVCAPEGQRSANSHCITVAGRIALQKIDFENARAALSISGTPADCVKIGIRYFKERRIDMDMVFSGINHGANLGTDTLYSGTVAAAIEGSLWGLPSVAVSVDDHNASHFDYASHLAVSAMEKAKGKTSSDMVLSINTPDLPRHRIKGVKYVKLSKRVYSEYFQMVDKKGSVEYYSYDREPDRAYASEDMSDASAIAEGYATITPLHRDLTDHGNIEEIKKWRIERI